MRSDPLASLSLINPLPAKLWGSHCVKCDKLQARWGITLARDSTAFICGLCILYESEWGRSNPPLVPSTIAAIERNSERKFTFTEGRLSCKDADDVLGVIVLTERTAARVPPSRR